ncbi:MAG: glycosyltransferase family 2 protein [Thermoguttaceae bacterium]
MTNTIVLERHEGQNSLPIISVVVPVFNEEAALNLFYETVSRQLDELKMSWEIVFVNDCSTDSSINALRTICSNDSRIKVLDFAKNFGNQVALTAGIEHAKGNAVIIMDADLQHPPEVIPEMVRLWQEEKYDSVYTIRTYNQQTSFFKKYTSQLFHKTLNVLSDLNLPEGISDFRLLDRKIVNYLNSMKEHPRFLRALISWLGFRQIGVPYTTNPRVAGESKFSFGKLLKLSLDGITGFSTKPLRWITYFGMLVATLGICYAGYIFYETLFIGLITPGWPTLIITLLLLGGTQLISLGVIGEYIGKIYMETKRRPLYVIQDSIGFEKNETDHISNGHSRINQEPNPIRVFEDEKSTAKSA